MSGDIPSVTIIKVSAKQFTLFVTITEYDPGLSTVIFLVVSPVDHLYEVNIEPASSTNGFLSQITVEIGLIGSTLITGLGRTFSVTLNGPALLTEAATEKKELRDELKTILAEMTYPKIVEQQGAMSDNLQKVGQKIPSLIFVG